MYILKNALKSILRSKGRNILIGIIVVVIAISSCIALSIKNAAAKVENEGLEALNVTAQISLDRQSLMAKAQEDGTDMRELIQSYSDPTLEELQEYAKSSNVKDFYYTLTSSINASGDLEPVDTSSTSSSTNTGGAATQEFRIEGGKDIPGGMGNQGDFSIIGYSSESAMTSFVSGVCKITDGAVFDINTSDKVCIISNELATLNGLSVGSAITLANPNVDTETYTFTVVGIYTNSSSTTTSVGGMKFSTSMDPANQIYTSYNTLQTMINESESVATTETDEDTGRTDTTALRSQTSGTYVLSDAESLEAFKTDAKTMGLSDYYTISSSDLTDYEQSLVPIKNLNTFATYFLLISLAIGGIILVVFNIFSIRERKFEVGVLTAIGMKKSKVGMQFIAELFMVTFIAIIIGTAIGSAISVPTADKLLESQLSSQQEQEQEQNTNFGRPGQGGGGQITTVMSPGFGFKNRAVNYISDINAAINFKVVMQLLGIGILLTIFSSFAAIVFIMRYEPLKILANRS